MGRKSLEERQAEMRDRLVREKLNSIGERIVVDAVKHTPAEPLQPVLPNVNWNVVLAQSTEPEIPFAARRLPQSRRDSSTCGSGVLSWGESAHGPRVHSHGSIANSQAAISRRKRFQAANPYRCTRSPQVCRRSQTHVPYQRTRQQGDGDCARAFVPQEWNQGTGGAISLFSARRIYGHVIARKDFKEGRETFQPDAMARNVDWKTAEFRQNADKLKNWAPVGHRKESAVNLPCETAPFQKTNVFEPLTLSIGLSTREFFYGFHSLPPR